MDTNPNNCSTCSHSKRSEHGHCYMWRETPTFVCHEHTYRKETEREAMLLAAGLLNVVHSLNAKKANGGNHA